MACWHCGSSGVKVCAMFVCLMSTLAPMRMHPEQLRGMRQKLKTTQNTIGNRKNKIGSEHGKKMCGEEKKILFLKSMPVNKEMKIQITDTQKDARNNEWWCNSGCKLLRTMNECWKNINILNILWVLNWHFVKQTFEYSNKTHYNYDDFCFFFFSILFLISEFSYFDAWLVGVRNFTSRTLMISAEGIN